MQEFEAKRKNLFDCLDAYAEQNLKGTSLDQSEKQNNYTNAIQRTKEGNLNVSKFRNKESFFKKPELPITKCLKPRTVPDYKINPHKWTKYSLEDVDISDRTNTMAAFQYLKELEEQKEAKRKLEANEDCSNEESAKITFNKLTNIKRHLEEIPQESDKTSDECDIKFKGSTMVMPEYSFGSKPKKEKRNTSQAGKESSATKKKKELTLSHLFDEENEDE